MRRIIVGALGALLVGGFGVAQAQEVQPLPTITIPVETVVEGPEDSQLLLATESLTDEGIPAGTVCNVTFVRNNNESVHLDNNLFIRSGTDAVFIPNFESIAGPPPPEELPFGAELTVDGISVTVSLEFGPDEVSSGGFTITLDCIQVSPVPPVVRPPVPQTPPGAVTVSPAGSGSPATSSAAVPAQAVAAQATFTG
jgi:hypothetical protein